MYKNKTIIFKNDVLYYPLRDRQLCMEAPGIKRSLEQLIFRMKTMVAGSDSKESTQVWVSTCFCTYFIKVCGVILCVD